ncbi:MAG: ATP synthase F0 subunit B [bacterium]
MISFDLEIFLIQLVIFILFLLFTSKFIVKPVLAVTDRRKELLSDGRGSAEKAEIKASDYSGKYQSNISSAHSEGAEMMKKARKKASEDRFEFVQKEKERTANYLSNKRNAIMSAGETLTKVLQDSENELVSMVCDKLWGSR